MSKKVIGLIPSTTTIDKGILMGTERTYVCSDYVKAIDNANATPVILPLIPEEESIKKYLEFCDGIIITGGDDISPKYYNDVTSGYCGMLDLNRDSFDYLVIKEAINKKIPILGICRGMQMINVYFGGSLYQDITLNSSFNIGHSQKSKKEVPTHNVTVSKDSMLYNIFGDEVWVNSFHHQAIKELGKGLIATGYSSDGLVEIIEEPSCNIIGVQWHPEMMASNYKMRELFKYYISLL